VGVHVSLERRTRQVREQLRVPQDFEQQEEQLLLALQVTLEALAEDSCDQVPNLVGVSRIGDEDPICLVHDNHTEHGADGQGGTEVESEQRGVCKERVALKIREDLKMNTLIWIHLT